MVGDGSYLMLSAELATAVQEDRKLIVVVLDNHGFQCIANLSALCGGHNTFNAFRRRNPQTGRLDGEHLAIDYAANARSLGADAIVAAGPGEFAAALAAARASRPEWTAISCPGATSGSTAPWSARRSRC